MKPHLQNLTDSVSAQPGMPVSTGRKIDVELRFPELCIEQAQLVGGNSNCDHDFPPEHEKLGGGLVYAFTCTRCKGIARVPRN